MTAIRNPLELYKLLPKSNCGQCYLPSCLAFAAAVLKGEKGLDDCPHLPPDSVARHGGGVDRRPSWDDNLQEQLAALRRQVAAVDFAEAAGRLGADLHDGKLLVRCLGKTFLVDRQGNVASECHTHAGLTIPLLSYIVHSKGGAPAGRWVPFRELEGGAPMSALFARRGEQNLRKLADSDPELFATLVTSFSARHAATPFTARVTVVLEPLPLLPVLLAYWPAEDDLESDLNIFFDAAADRHLPIDNIFSLAVGMVMMFEKIAKRHG
ncbi:MAG: DUF3786 domain-containing protein [Thermodesulfobacteriota bacterium]